MYFSILAVAKLLTQYGAYNSNSVLSDNPNDVMTGRCPSNRFLGTRKPASWVIAKGHNHQDVTQW